MDITKSVAKLRFIYHTNMLDVCNVANQLGLLRDAKAEIVMKKHCFKIFDCLERLGYDVNSLNKKEES
jgi:hypothetical protein